MVRRRECNLGKCSFIDTKKPINVRLFAISSGFFSAIIGRFPPRRGGRSGIAEVSYVAKVTSSFCREKLIKFVFMVALSMMDGVSSSDVRDTRSLFFAAVACSSSVT